MRECSPSRVWSTKLRLPSNFMGNSYIAVLDNGGGMSITEGELLAMSVDDLWLLHQRTGRTLAMKIMFGMRELEKVLVAFDRWDAARALSRSDHRSEHRKTRRKYPKVLPKYCNPSVPSETWSGRGRQPRWLVAAVRSGQEIESFKIGCANASD
jgi:DNA-binding protein H-NS